MAYTGGYSGDYKALDLIVKTLWAKSYERVGNQKLHYSVAGEVAFGYVGMGTTAAATVVGNKATFGVKGKKRVDVSLTSDFQVATVVPIPWAVGAVNTFGQDIVQDQLMDELTAQGNLYNNQIITSLVSAGTAKTYPSNLTSAYDMLVNAVATYKTDNKKSAHRPDWVLVSSEFMADLISDDKVSRMLSVNALNQGGIEKNEGQVRELVIPGIEPVIVETPDLTGCDFIMIQSEGVWLPLAIKNVQVADAFLLGYVNGGVALGAAIPYGIKILTASDAANLDSSTGYFVAKFTQASQASA